MTVSCVVVVLSHVFFLFMFFFLFSSFFVSLFFGFFGLFIRLLFWFRNILRTSVFSMQFTAPQIGHAIARVEGIPPKRLKRAAEEPKTDRPSKNASIEFTSGWLHGAWRRVDVQKVDVQRANGRRFPV